jgi:hypothetical protein
MVAADCTGHQRLPVTGRYSVSRSTLPPFLRYRSCCQPSAEIYVRAQLRKRNSLLIMTMRLQRHQPQALKSEYNQLLGTNQQSAVGAGSIGMTGSDEQSALAFLPSCVADDWAPCKCSQSSRVNQQGTEPPTSGLISQCYSPDGSPWTLQFFASLSLRFVVCRVSTTWVFIVFTTYTNTAAAEQSALLTTPATPSAHSFRTRRDSGCLRPRQ